MAKVLPQVNRVDEPFWRGAAAGKLLLQKCRECGKPQFFPRPVCTACFSNALDWIPTTGLGKVHSFSWVWAPRNPAFKEEVPICYADIILDEGVLLQSRIVCENIREVKTGARVKVVFQETESPEVKLPVFELTG